MNTGLEISGGGVSQPSESNYMLLVQHLRDGRDERSTNSEISSGRKNITALDERRLVMMHLIHILFQIRANITVPKPQLEKLVNILVYERIKRTHLFTK